MLVSAMSVLVVAQSCSEIPEGLMNNPVLNSVTCLETFGKVRLGDGDGQTYFLPTENNNKQKLKNLIQKF